MQAERTENPLVAYARAILISRILGMLCAIAGLFGIITQFLISTSVFSEISLLGNDGLTTNNFTYINRIFNYDSILFILFLIMFFTAYALLLLYRNAMVKRTIELTGAESISDLNSKVKEKGGILRLSLSKHKG
ncbi:MAG: hypothetical protein M1422_08380 [Candidatus Thermoplasmatota archaeon]|jgi:hypothetical protein|nr:hypothetical protein [Candidatus Thermoplasmatota archaeon]